MCRRDAEIAADVGEHGADRPVADVAGEFFRRGQCVETRVRQGGARWGGGAEGARLAGRGRACGLGIGIQAGGAGLNAPGSGQPPLGIWLR